MAEGIRRLIVGLILVLDGIVKILTFGIVNIVGEIEVNTEDPD